MPFVANRVGEIHRSSNPQQWRHVPGDMNPADLSTRGLSATELANSKLWAEGPGIIQGEESTWPPQLPNEHVEESIDKYEKRKVTHATSESQNDSSIEANYFSNFRSLVRTFAWVRRFVNNCKLPNESRKKSQTLCLQELKDSETWWIKKAQLEGFPEGKTDSRLTRLNPKEDDDGLLRVDGRDTDSFINAFSRMVARRGTPAFVLSDNGTNFVGAERELCPTLRWCI